MKDRSTERTKAPIGSGARFKALVGQLSSDKSIENPSALAASIGRKKYGKSRMSAMASAGKKNNFGTDSGD